MVIRASCRYSFGNPPPEEFAGDGFPVRSAPTLGEKEDSLQYFRQLMPSLLASRTSLGPETVSRKLNQAWGKTVSGEDPAALATAFRQALYHPVSSSADFFAFGGMIGRLWNNFFLSNRNHPTELAIQYHLVGAVIAAAGDQFEKETLRVNEFLQERHKLEANRELLFSMDLAKQMDVLKRHIPHTGINSCYISLFKDQLQKNQEKAACILAIRNKQWIDPESLPKEFLSSRLVPDDFLSDPSPHMLIVEAMKEIGFIFYEMRDKPDRFYAYLSDIICGAVQAAVLYTAVKDQRNSLNNSLTHIWQAMAGFIQTMSATVETRDPYAAGHQRRVSDLARTIATEMGLSASKVDCVRMAGIIHDLGKIYIPAEILNRAGVLDDIEWSMIKKHPKAVWDILKNIEFP
jgi:HD-GYP domain-containing protein (c-di-GMP phosphodiesterase class II)